MNDMEFYGKKVYQEQVDVRFVLFYDLQHNSEKIFLC